MRRMILAPLTALFAVAVVSGCATPPDGPWAYSGEQGYTMTDPAMVGYYGGPAYDFLCCGPTFAGFVGFDHFQHRHAFNHDHGFQVGHTGHAGMAGRGDRGGGGHGGGGSGDGGGHR